MQEHPPRHRMVLLLYQASAAMGESTTAESAQHDLLHEQPRMCCLAVWFHDGAGAAYGNYENSLIKNHKGIRFFPPGKLEHGWGSLRREARHEPETELTMSNRTS